MGAFTVNLKTDDFKGAVEKDGILFVDFWASWCGPCRSFAPVYEDVAGENPDIVFAKVDTDAEQQIAAAFQIQSMMIFRERVMVFAQPGALPKGALQSLVKQVRELDMDEVRKEIAAHEAEAVQAHDGGSREREANDEAAGESEA
jgi:thioredoxin 1